MLAYLKYKLKRLIKRKIKLPLQYPIYYEQDGILIREEADGSKFKIDLDDKYQEQIIQRIN